MISAISQNTIVSVNSLTHSSANTGIRAAKYIVERNGKFAKLLDPNVQIWIRSQEFAQQFPTFAQARTAIQLAKVRANVKTIFPAPAVQTPAVQITPPIEKSLIQKSTVVDVVDLKSNYKHEGPFWTDSEVFMNLGYLTDGNCEAGEVPEDFS